MQEMEANTRKLQQALVPLGEKIVELANVVLPPLVAIITAVSDVFNMLPEPVQNFVVILGALLVAFTALTPAFKILRKPVLLLDKRPQISYSSTLSRAVHPAGARPAVKFFTSFSKKAIENFPAFRYPDVNRNTPPPRGIESYYHGGSRKL